MMNNFGNFFLAKNFSMKRGRKCREIKQQSLIVYVHKDMVVLFLFGARTKIKREMNEQFYILYETESKKESKAENSNGKFFLSV